MRNKGIQRYFLLDGYRYRSVQHFGKLSHLVFSALRTSGFSPLGLRPQLSKVIKQERLRRSQRSESGASEWRTKQKVSTSLVLPVSIRVQPWHRLPCYAI